MESTGLELSAKITRSVCMHLEAQGALVGDYLEQAGLSTHKALDSEMWLPVEQVELFLDLVLREFPNFSPKDVALNALEVRGWGLLDQVLRILQSPSEIYEHPQKFLSYFVRPNLNFEWLERKKEISSFTVSLSTDELPLVTEYLTGALEVVSKYVGTDCSLVSWKGKSVSIDWSKKQESFFEIEKPPVNYKPEVYKEAVEIIQRQQNELLEFRSKELEVKNLEFEKESDSYSLDTENIADDLKILSDYFLRARQLVSLLKAESGKKKWFKEAVKRLNWDELQGLHSSKVDDINKKLTKQSQPPGSQMKTGEQIGLRLDS